MLPTTRWHASHTGIKSPAAGSRDKEEHPRNVCVPQRDPAASTRDDLGVDDQVVTFAYPSIDQRLILTESLAALFMVQDCSSSVARPVP